MSLIVTLFSWGQLNLEPLESWSFPWGSQRSLFVNPPVSFWHCLSHLLLWFSSCCNCNAFQVSIVLQSAACFLFKFTSALPFGHEKLTSLSVNSDVFKFPKERRGTGGREPTLLWGVLPTFLHQSQLRASFAVETQVLPFYLTMLFTLKSLSVFFVSFLELRIYFLFFMFKDLQTEPSLALSLSRKLKVVLHF